MANGRLSAVSSERILQQLDDAIKAHFADVYEATEVLTPEDLNNIIPMAFPMTHNVGGCELIAKYPADNWNDQGRPTPRRAAGAAWQ